MEAADCSKLGKNTFHRGAPQKIYGVAPSRRITSCLRGKSFTDASNFNLIQTKASNKANRKSNHRKDRNEAEERPPERRSGEPCTGAETGRRSGGLVAPWNSGVWGRHRRMRARDSPRHLQNANGTTEQWHAYHK